MERPETEKQQTENPPKAEASQKENRKKDTQPDWGPVYENAIKQAEDLIDDPHETIDVEKLMGEVDNRQIHGS